MFRITAIAALAATLSCSAANAGDAQNGLLLARQWCTSCHQVEQSGPIRDFVPSFVSLANRHDQDLSWVRLWLMNPHPPMTGLNLSRAQIDDVVAYLTSLQSTPATNP
jgi:mono/diheme cytochrome c family protein